MENQGEKGLFAGAVSGNRLEISAGGIKRRKKRKKTQKDKGRAALWKKEEPTKRACVFAGPFC
jgi:hypothetical protein